jgi:hypothetical protein
MPEEAPVIMTTLSWKEFIFSLQVQVSSPLKKFRVQLSGCARRFAEKLKLEL